MSDKLCQNESCDGMLSDHKRRPTISRLAILICVTIILIVAFFDLQWACGAAEEQWPHMSVSFLDKLENFVLNEGPAWLRKNLFSWMFGAVGGILGLTLKIPFIPEPIKEHFTSSNERLLSFFFLTLIVTGMIRFIFSFLISPIGMIQRTVNAKMENILNKMSNKTLYARGKEEGIHAGESDAKAVNKSKTINRKRLVDQWDERHKQPTFWVKTISFFSQLIVWIIRIMLVIAVIDMVNTI